MGRALSGSGFRFSVLSPPAALACSCSYAESAEAPLVGLFDCEEGGRVILLLSKLAEVIEFVAEFWRPRFCPGLIDGSLAENVPITGDEVRYGDAPPATLFCVSDALFFFTATSYLFFGAGPGFERFLGTISGVSLGLA